MARPLASKGSWQGSRRRQAPDPANLVACSPLPLLAQSPSSWLSCRRWRESSHRRSSCSSQASRSGGVTGRHRTAVVQRSPPSVAFWSGGGARLIFRESQLPGTREKEQGGKTPGSGLELNRRRAREDAYNRRPWGAT